MNISTEAISGYDRTKGIGWLSRIRVANVVDYKLVEITIRWTRVYKSDYENLADDIGQQDIVHNDPIVISSNGCNLKISWVAW